MQHLDGGNVARRFRESGEVAVAVAGVLVADLDAESRFARRRRRARRNHFQIGVGIALVVGDVLVVIGALARRHADLVGGANVRVVSKVVDQRMRSGANRARHTEGEEKAGELSEHGLRARRSRLRHDAQGTREDEQHRRAEQERTQGDGKARRLEHRDDRRHDVPSHRP